MPQRLCSRAVALTASLWACAAACAAGIYESVPIDEDEWRLIEESKDLEGYFNAQSLLYRDPQVLDLVRGVGHEIRPAPTDDYIEYEFFVLRDPSPNAFALPNGHVYVHTGMLARLRDEDQLAALLAHEVNHVAGHHGMLGDAWQGMGARGPIDATSLSNSDKRQNRRERVRMTRAQRLAQLLETEEGRAAYAANLKRAEETYRRVLAMDPTFAPAHRGLGEVYEQQQRARDAAESYLTYVRQAPDAADRPIVMGRLRALTAKLKGEQ